MVFIVTELLFNASIAASVMGALAVVNAHPSNALPVMASIPAGKLIVFNFSHPANALSPIFFKLTGKATSDKKLHPLKALLSMLVIPLPMVTFFR